MRVQRQGERPLRFGVQWTRMVNKLLGIDSMKSVALIKVQEAKRNKASTMMWVNELLKAEALAAEVEDDFEDGEETPRPLSRFDEHRRRLVEMAMTSTFGDTRTLVAEASSPKKRGWRRDWTVDQRIRAEKLRLAAMSGELEWEHEAARKAITYQRPLQPDSFDFMNAPTSNAPPWKATRGTPHWTPTQIIAMTPG